MRTGVEKHCSRRHYYIILTSQIWLNNEESPWQVTAPPRNFTLFYSFIALLYLFYL